MPDSRLLTTGRTIPALHYADQPYIVVLNDGSWFCTLTTGTGEEGRPGQHVVALRSFDQGANWSEPVPIEPGISPTSPLPAPLGMASLLPILNMPLETVVAPL